MVSLEKLCFTNLVERIVQTLVEVVEVTEDDALADLHGDLDAIDVQTNLSVLLVIGKARAKDD